MSNGFREVSSEIFVDPDTGLDYKLIANKIEINITGDETQDNIRVQYDKVFYDNNGKEFKRVGTGYITKNIYEELDPETDDILIEENLKIKNWDTEIGGLISTAIISTMKEINGLL